MSRRWMGGKTHGSRIDDTVGMTEVWTETIQGCRKGTGKDLSFGLIWNVIHRNQNCGHFYLRYFLVINTHRHYIKSPYLIIMLVQ